MRGKNASWKKTWLWNLRGFSIAFAVKLDYLLTLHDLQTWLNAASAKGMEIQGTFQRKQKEPFMFLTFYNKAMQPMTGFAIQFNKNRWGACVTFCWTPRISAPVGFWHAECGFKLILVFRLGRLPTQYSRAAQLWGLSDSSTIGLAILYTWNAQIAVRPVPCDEILEKTFIAISVCYGLRKMKNSQELFVSLCTVRWFIAFAASG